MAIKRVIWIIQTKSKLIPEWVFFIILTIDIINSLNLRINAVSRTVTHLKKNYIIFLNLILFIWKSVFLGQRPSEWPRGAFPGSVYRPAQHVYRDGVLPKRKLTGRAGKRADQAWLDVPLLTHARHPTGQWTSQSKLECRSGVTAARHELTLIFTGVKIS